MNKSMSVSFKNVMVPTHFGKPTLPSHQTPVERKAARAKKNAEKRARKARKAGKKRR